MIEDMPELINMADPETVLMYVTVDGQLLGIVTVNDLLNGCGEV